jgi:hypothetical protein
MEPVANNASAKIISALIIGLIVGFVGGVFWQDRRDDGAKQKEVAAEIIKETKEMKSAADSKVAPGTAAAAAVAAEAAREKERPTVTAITASTPAAPIPAEIAVAEQAAGGTVAIALLRVSEPVWVAVREVGADGKMGNILGAHKVFPGDKSVIVELLRPTKAGGMYAAVLHRDAGDPAFNYREDIAIAGVEGRFTAK